MSSSILYLGRWSSLLKWWSWECRIFDFERCGMHSWRGLTEGQLICCCFPLYKYYIKVLLVLFPLMCGNPGHFWMSSSDSSSLSIHRNWLLRWLTSPQSMLWDPQARDFMDFNYVLFNGVHHVLHEFFMSTCIIHIYIYNDTWHMNKDLLECIWTITVYNTT